MMIQKEMNNEWNRWRPGTRSNQAATLKSNQFYKEATRLDVNNKNKKTVTKTRYLNIVFITASNQIYIYIGVISKRRELIHKILKSNQMDGGEIRGTSYYVGMVDMIQS